MITWKPTPPRDASTNKVAEAIGGLIDAKINTTQQVEYAVQAPACDGIPTLTVLNNLDCGGETAGPLVLATRLGGKPIIISRPSGSGTSVLPPSSTTTQGVGNRRGRFFVDAIGQMFDGRGGAYHPLPLSPAGPNGRYLGIAPESACADQVFPGNPVFEGTGIWWLGGDGTVAPGYFEGSWEITDGLYLTGNLGLDEPLTALSSQLYTGILLPIPPIQVQAVPNGESELRTDFLRPATPGSSPSSVMLQKMPAEFWPLGFGSGALGWWDGTDPFFSPGRTPGGTGPLDDSLCTGPTPMAYRDPWPVFIGLCETAGPGVRVSSDLIASIEGNVPDARWPNTFTKYDDASPRVTLTVRDAETYQRIGSCLLPEVEDWIMRTGPRARFTWERANAAPWAAGIRAFPVTDGTWCVTVKDSTRAWIYEVVRTGSLESPSSFPALAASPEPADLTYTGGFSFQGQRDSIVGDAFDLTAIDGRTGATTYAFIAGDGWNPAAIVTIQGSDNGGSSWTSLVVVPIAEGTGGGSWMVTWSGAGHEQVRAVLDVTTGDPSGFSNSLSVYFQRGPRTESPWDTPSFVRLLETVNVSGGSDPVGFLRAVYLD